jgi:peptidoglycan/LPS O-acetylase OafA/YrhL
MLLAGASVWFTLGKRSNRQYLRERLLHVGLPFIILTLSFIVPAAYWTRSSAGQFSGSPLEFYLHFFEGIAPTGNFTLFHMWFLLYLLIYALLTLPLFRFFECARGRRFIDQLARACQRPGGIYLFALPLLAVQLALSRVALQPESPALVNDWTRFVSLLLVFIFGYLLVSDGRFQQAIAQQWLLASAIAVGTSAVLFAIAWPDTFNPYRDLPLDYSSQYVAFWTVFALGSWSWLIAWLGFGQRYLNVNHPLLKRAGEASYPLYLLHPLLWMPGLFLVSQWQSNALIAFLVLMTIDLTGTLALIVILKRWRITRY